MKVAIHVPVGLSASGPAVETDLDLDGDELGDMLAAGAGLSAQPGATNRKTGEPSFGRCGYVAVSIDPEVLSVEQALASSFVQDYATLVLHGGGDSLLVFALPSAETDVRRYVALQAGIEARFAGARRAAGSMAIYRAGASGQQTRLSGRLDPDAVRELIRFGEESQRLRKAEPDQTIRSRLWIDMQTAIRPAGADDETVPLQYIANHAHVYCPVHIDSDALAYVERLHDGRPAIACLHCRRTYTLRDTSNDYDFDHWDKTVASLAAEQVLQPGERVQFDLRDERYLSALPTGPGVICVKSPKGSGKTEQLAKVVANSQVGPRKHRERVLLISHRRALCRSMATRLGLRCYITEDEEVIEEQRRQDQLERLLDFGHEEVHGPAPLKARSPTRKYAVSLDSLTLLDPAVHCYDIVIIDECEQVLAHLVGKTLRDKRREVFHRLRHYLRKASTVILLDADLGMVTMEALFAIGLFPETPVSFVLNQAKQAVGSISTYEIKGQLVDRMRAAVEAGEKCYVATNSKNTAIDLQKMLLKDWPDRRIVAVHSDNASDDDMVALIADITGKFERSIDVLIASPVIGTGIDITFKDLSGQPRVVVDHVFGVFHGLINTHQDIDQQLMRVRHPGAVHVWVDSIEHDFETDPGVIKRQLGLTVAETRVLLGYSDSGERIEAKPDGLLDIWSEVRAAHMGSKNRLAALFHAAQGNSGQTVVAVPRDDEASEEGREAVKMGRELRVEERVDAIMAAPVVDARTAADLQRKERLSLPLTAVERASLIRHRLERFYAEDVSPELIDFDEEGRTQGRIRNLECMLASDEANAASDKEDADDDRHVIDRRLRSVKAGLLRAALASAGVYDQNGRALLDAAIVEQSTLGPFVAHLRGKQGEFDSAFDVRPRRDAAVKSVQQLGVVLNLVGLELKVFDTKDVGGKKERRYALDGERLSRVREVLAQRAEAAREWAASKEKVKEDVATSRKRSLAAIARLKAGGDIH